MKDAIDSGTIYIYVRTNISVQTKSHMTIKLLLAVLFAYCSLSFSFAPNAKEGCIEIERRALLQFKKGLKDPSDLLSSWVGEDCCRWRGVGCNNKTGHVVKLDLRNEDCFKERMSTMDSDDHSLCFCGEISTSLLDLKFLNYLDLSMNDFQGMPIPDLFGSLEKLTYLNLSYSSFAGKIPYHLGNLSNLQYLDLYSNPNSFGGFLSGSYSIVDSKSALASDLNWVSGLSSLQYLDLSYVNLSLAGPNWLHTLNMLPSLSDLHLSGCNLSYLPDAVPVLNFTSLLTLHLSHNSFINSSLPQWLNNMSTLLELHLEKSHLTGPITNIAWGKLCNLQSVDLSGNEISGEINELIQSMSQCNNSHLEGLYLAFNQLSGQLPDSLGDLKKARFLRLDDNMISGPIPASIESLSNLEELDLSYNKMNGSIPQSLGTLSKLAILQLCNNDWEGILSQNIFQALTQLKELSISASTKHFVFYVSQEWIPSFSLLDIEIRDCRLGPKFPAWIRSQKEINSIILKNVSISNTVPLWLWEITPQLSWLDLSNNQITGTLPKSLEFSPETWVDLSSNMLKGSIPHWPNLSYLILSNNQFSGSIPMNIGQVMSSMRYLYLSDNFLSGSIPSSIAKMTSLSRLDLSNNNLSGEIHDQWWDLQELKRIDLSGNNLSGNIPKSLWSLPVLSFLKLTGNKFSGELSFSLKISTGLTFIDLGENKFTGKLPSWEGTSLPSLIQLRLRDNLFSGKIPEQLCHLSSLRVLDLAVNNLSGAIPPCLVNLSAMSSQTSYYPRIPTGHYMYTPEMEFSMKGRKMKYNVTLELVKVLDLSKNKLWGEIPKEIANLSALGTLNLSHNQLRGKIPENIGDLKRLETLDLSSNYLSGPIPPSMSSITSLNHLNLSFNNLSGPIPSTNQFLTLNDPSIYEGNPELCGLPLSTKCPNPTDEEDGNENSNDGEDEDKYEKLGFYVSMGLGFIVGFWVVCGSLVIKKSWRHAYFRLVDSIKDWLFVVIAIGAARLRRKIRLCRSYCFS